MEENCIYQRKPLPKKSRLATDQILLNYLTRPKSACSSLVTATDLAIGGRDPRSMLDKERGPEQAAAQGRWTKPACNFNAAAGEYLPMTSVRRFSWCLPWVLSDSERCSRRAATANTGKWNTDTGEGASAAILTFGLNYRLLKKSNHAP